MPAFLFLAMQGCKNSEELWLKYLEFSKKICCIQDLACVTNYLFGLVSNIPHKAIDQFFEVYYFL